MTEKYKKYLKSDEWNNIRIELFLSRGRQCERCASKNKLAIHQLTYKNIYYEEPEDLIILCQYCHRKEHNIGKKKKKRKFRYKTIYINKNQ